MAGLVSTLLRRSSCTWRTVTGRACGTSIRSISTSYPIFSNNSDLERAKERLKSLTADPGNQTKLKLYGLYKQATIGPCNAPKPGALDFVGKAKWGAWNELGNLSQSDAVKQYVELVDQLVGNSETVSSSSSSTPSSGSTGDDLLITDTKGLRTITLNRPTKYNAITWDMYTGIGDALKTAAEDSKVVTVMITGAGNYYCSGNDLSNFMNIPPEGPAALAKAGSRVLREFVSSFIQFPKPLIAAVNGPAVGISVTLLGLCDLVYAADNATFHTPFMSLGQSPEACSSLLFPRIMSPARANEMLLAGHKLSVNEAYERGLITRIFPQQGFAEKVNQVAIDIASLPPQSLHKSKMLIRSSQLQLLEDVNKKECDLLEERWQSVECMEAIINFMQRKK